MARPELSDLGRLLDPATIAIVGLSSDSAKHGGRVLGNLRKLGFEGDVWGVNPGLPDVADVEMYSSIGDLPRPPDLVVSAVPAPATVDVVSRAEGAGCVIVLAGGFGESGEEGGRLEHELSREAAAVGVRLLGPNSGGVIRPGRSLAASFLTCLDRPAEEIRTGPVGVVTQSGGTGSYLHNLAAARGGGLAISVSTGNEVDIKLGEAIGAVADLDEVKAVLVLVETVRDGEAFVTAVETAGARGKPVVACRLGTGDRGKSLMITHTGAMAVPDAVLGGVLDSLGVVGAETPGDAYEVAEMMARAPAPDGGRAGIVTHSGGMAIHLADLAEKSGLELQPPSPYLQERLDPLLDHGAANNPVDMGGIIGGPGRFVEVIDVFARSGEYDLVLAVSTAHPPAHSDERVRSLLDLVVPVPLLHLWMGGDQTSRALDTLWRSGTPVTEEPRAALRTLAGLARLGSHRARVRPGPITGDLGQWGLPLVEGGVVDTPEGAFDLADRLGYPVVLKTVSPGLAHKTERGGVELDLKSREAVLMAYDELGSAMVRVERFRPGLEMIVGGVVDETFGPMISVGMGGVFTELVEDVVFAPAPVDVEEALRMIDRLRGRSLLDGWRGAPPADVAELARLVSVVSRGLVGSGLREVEVNPLVWDGIEWVAVDWLMVDGGEVG